MNNYFVGVDPGASGGVAIIYYFNGKNICTQGMSMPIVKVDGKPTLDTHILKGFLPGIPFIAVLEQVAAMPGQGVSSMFQFGRMFGAVEAMLDNTAEEVIYVWPRRWKRYFKVGADKQDAIDCADYYFGKCPQWHQRGKRGGTMLASNSGVAEAALLGLYGVFNHGD